jgi:hypothetical protein
MKVAEAILRETFDPALAADAPPVPAAFNPLPFGQRPLTLGSLFVLMT